MSSPNLTPGAVFARDYTIVRPLSEGGMGAVYVVEQISTGAQRALKLMHKELVQDPKLRQRFEQEARIGSRIESEHVVQVLGAGIDEGSGMPWLVMELLQGQDLAALLEARGALPPAEIRDIFAQLTHAIAAAHRVGVVHRDLKPENVFIARSRREGETHSVKVLDFGIAKVAAEARATATQALGTPIWMAPEQTERSRTIGPPADVWALGLIAFRMLTGKYFWHAANTEESTYTMVLREAVFDPIPTASARAAEYGVGNLIPPGFDAWFARCAAREPEARFADAGLAREAFAEVFGRASTLPAQPAFTPPALATQPNTTPVATSRTTPGVPQFNNPPPPKPASSSSNAPIFGAVGIVLLAGLGIGGRAMLRSQKVQACESGKGDDLRAACKVACDIDPKKYCVPHGDLARADKDGRPEALKSYEKACSAGNVTGCRKQGSLEEQNHDDTAAVQSFQKACSTDAAACAPLARHLESGRGIARDLAKADTIYSSTCSIADPEGCALLGFRGENRPYPVGDLGEIARVYEKAAPGLRKECESGGLWHCLALGHLLQHGKGIERDPAGAAAAYRKACDGGLTDACTNAATLDLATALPALRDACTAGSQAACNNVAVLQTGNPFAARQLQGITVFRLACSASLPLGCTAAPSTAPPPGAVKDLPAAAATLEKACESGLGVACANLGAMHESGILGARDPQKATALYEKGCAAGAPDGCGTMKDLPFKAGDSWMGHYLCAQGQTDLVVRVLDPAADQRVHILFEFNYAPAKVYGRFLMSGNYDAAKGSIVFAPGNWVEQPPNYIGVGMSGQVSAQKTIYTGKMDHPACGPVRLVRMTSDMIDTTCPAGAHFVDGHGCVPVPRPPTAIGSWSGKGTESNGSTWTINATITSLEQGRCGKVAYPTLSCSGDWYCTKSTDGRTVRAREIITSGQTRCDSTGFVDLTLSEDGQSADWRWSSPLRAGGSTARLSRSAQP